MQYRDIQLSAVTFPGIKSAGKFTEASKNVRNEVAPYVANACCLTKYTGAGSPVQNAHYAQYIRI